MDSRVRGQRKPYKQQHARSSPSHSHPGLTHTLRGDGHPARGQPRPIAFWASPCPTGPAGTGLFFRTPTAHGRCFGFDLYTLTLGFARGVSGTETRPLTPSSTSSPPPTGTNHLTRLPHLTPTTNDGPHCISQDAQLHNTRRLPQAGSVRFTNKAGCVAFWDL